MRIGGSNPMMYTPPTRSQSAAASGSASSTADSTSSSGAGAGLDFTNMTGTQMIDGMNSLIRSGKMTLDQSSALVGLARTPLTQATADASTTTQSYNVIGELKAGIEGSKSRGEMASAQKETDVLNILQSLSGNSGVDIKA